MLVTSNADGDHLTFVPEHWSRADIAYALAALAADCAQREQMEFVDLLGIIANEYMAMVGGRRLAS